MNAFYGSEQFKDKAALHAAEVRAFDEKLQEAVRAVEKRNAKEVILERLHEAYRAAQDISDEDKRKKSLDTVERLQERALGPKPKGKTDGGEQNFHEPFDSLQKIPPRTESH